MAKTYQSVTLQAITLSRLYLRRQRVWVERPVIRHGRALTCLEAQWASIDRNAI